MYSDNIKLWPWEGSNYNKTNPKILILGMSIYDKTKGRDVVQNYIKGLINDNWNYSFFTRIINMFNNENHWEKIEKDNYQLKKELFWNDVCFYEYIQDRMDEPLQKTPNKYWENAKEPFLEILKKLKPDIVIALGYETYNNLPDIGEDGIRIQHKKNILENWKYKVGNKEIFVCKIEHPSSPRFNIDKHIELFDKFLKKYKKNFCF
jgi:hypothetical protein